MEDVAAHEDVIDVLVLTVFDKFLKNYPIFVVARQSTDMDVSCVRDAGHIALYDMKIKGIVQY